MTQPLVLDVSNKATIGPMLLRRSGAVALIAKATEGVSFIDKTYPAHRATAAKAGVPFGGYLFLHADSPGSQADYFLAHARPKRGDIQPMVDAETGMPSPEGTRALACLRHLEAAGYTPLLYASSSYLREMLMTAPELAKYRIWEAAYGSTRNVVGRGVSVALWQFTDRYRVLWRRYDASRLYVPLASLLIR